MIGVCRFELSRWILLHFYRAEHWMTCILCLYGNSCSLEYPSVSRSPWRHLLGSLPPSYRSCQGSPLIPRLCVFPWRCSCCGVSGFGMRREVRHDWSVWGREGSAWQAADAFFLAGWQQTASGVNRVLTDSLPSVTQQPVVDTRRLSLSID